jgi:hypothetical protein
MDTGTRVGLRGYKTNQQTHKILTTDLKKIDGNCNFFFNID